MVQNKFLDERLEILEDRYNGNAENLSNADISESGGGQIKSLSKSNFDKSRFNSPVRSNNMNTLSPEIAKQVFRTKHEVSMISHNIIRRLSNPKGEK